MFNLFKPKTINNNSISATLKLSGMHCTSCANNVDLSLEDLPGVESSNTNFQKSEVLVSFDPSKTDLKKIIKEIVFLGYQVEE